MNVTKINIKEFKQGGFYSSANEGVKHVKVLPLLSIVQATEGSYDIALGNGAIRKTGDGGFFIAPANVKQTIVHHVSSETKTMSARWLFIDVEVNDIYRMDELYRFPVVIDGDAEKKTLNDIFDRLFKTESIWEKYSICYEILNLLTELSTPMIHTEHQGITKALLYMTQNFEKPVTIAELAEISFMSKSNFHSVFKKQFGISPLSYLNHYRLSIAAEKLKEDNLTVNEIAFSVGIHDALYFSKIFKKAYGISPKDYRLMHKPKSTK